jgi:hypothetical protein
LANIPKIARPVYVDGVAVDGEHTIAHCLDEALGREAEPAARWPLSGYSTEQVDRTGRP